MNLGPSFWNQPSTSHRNAQLLFAALTLTFGVASIVYAAFPTWVTSQFALMDALLGGDPAGYPEPQNRVWTSLAAANVATLCLMSYHLLRDLPRHRAMHLPLLFMKTASALLFLAWFTASPGARSLLVAFVSDFFTGVAIWWLPRRALAELDTPAAAQHVPLLGG
jgi:hypothetical protein